MDVKFIEKSNWINIFIGISSDYVSLFRNLSDFVREKKTSSIRIVYKQE